MPQFAVADTSSAAASLLNGLNAAANQKVTQDQQQNKEQFANETALIKQGYTKLPPPPSTSTSANGRPSILGTGAAAGGSPFDAGRTGDDQTVVEPVSKAVWRKTPEAPALDDTNSFVAPPGSALEGWMQKEAGVKPGTRIGYTHVPALMELHKSMQPEKDPSETWEPVTLKGPDGKDVEAMRSNRNHFALPDLSGVNGAMPGGPFDQADQGSAPAASPPQTPGASPNGAFTFKPPEKAEKAPKSLHFETHTNDKGDVTTFGYDPETMELKSTHVAKGVGPQRKDPTDPNAPKPMSGAQARIIVQNKAKALSDAQKAYTKDTSEAITDEDRSTANTNLRHAQQQAQLNYESELSAATGNEIPHNPWADAGADAPVRPKAATATPGKTQPPAKQPAQPGAAQPAPAAKAATGAPGAVEGTIIHSKANPKVRMILKGGQWKTLAP